MIGRLFSGLIIWVLRVITLDGLVEWHRLPRMLGVIRLVAYRSMLIRKNLYDTSTGPSGDPPEPGPDFLTMLLLSLRNLRRNFRAQDTSRLLSCKLGTIWQSCSRTSH